MITLRPATTADLPGAVEVFWACWTRSYAAFATPEQLARLTRADADALWADAWSRDQTLVATCGAGRVVGLVRYGLSAGVTAVHSLYVDPDLQGGGVGGRLLAAATGAGLAAGATDSSLWVFADNAGARDFYARHGFVPDGTTRTEEQFGLPEVRLRRTRTPLDALTRLLVETPPPLTDTPPPLTDTPPPLIEAPPPLIEPVEITPDSAHPVVSTSSTTVGRGGTPPAGAVLGTWSAEDGVRTAAAGVRGPDGAPMTTGTVFDLASVTKLFTTAAVLRLTSADEITLDAPLDTYLPFPGPAPTVRQLLQHRAGLLPWQPLYLAADHPAGALDVLRALPRAGEPGTVRHYSDLGFILLGAVISTVTGRDLRSSITELITAPLGLSAGYGPRTGADLATGALDDRVERQMVATGEPYPVVLAGDFDGWRTTPATGVVNDGNAHHALGDVSGHAGLFACVDDLIRFGRALTHTDHGLWRAEVLAEFLSPGPDPEQGLGFRVRDLGRGRRLVWHPGFTGTALGVCPGPDPVVVAMATNRLVTEGAPVPTGRLWDLVLRGLGIEPADEQPAAPDQTGQEEGH